MPPQPGAALLRGLYKPVAIIVERAANGHALISQLGRKSLRGFKPPRYSVHVNGPWCVTFEFEGGAPDFEQYH